MQPVFIDSQNLERKVKENYSIPDFLMMENAATYISNLITRLFPANLNTNILILCGKGNNGGDGFAVARLLQQKFNIQIHYVQEPSAPEAKIQYEMCKKLGIKFITQEDFIQNCKNASILLDCLYGTGFHGELNQSDINLLTAMNNSSGKRIACDIPSALFFNADYTVTMGCLKTQLFSDKAKAVCGEIFVAPLGISNNKFISLDPPDANLLEKSDMTLPFRKNKSVHKGNFGHAVTFAGEKSGAGIIGATAALNIGAGFSSIYKTENSNLEQFKLSPELMIFSDKIPDKATSIQIGSGLGQSSKAIQEFQYWFENTKNPACVIDADLFNYSELQYLLEKLNSIKNARIVLTPHPKELTRITEKLGIPSESKLIIAEEFFKRFNNITLVMKGANTFIASEGKIYICSDGNQSLAKAGSGDVLAGLINGLLAQGYSAKDATITGVMIHALASSSDEFKDSFSLTPEKLIQKVSEISKEITK